MFPMLFWWEHCWKGHWEKYLNIIRRWIGKFWLYFAYLIIFRINGKKSWWSKDMTLAENDVSNFNFLQLPLADNFFCKNSLHACECSEYASGLLLHAHKYETLLWTLGKLRKTVFRYKIINFSLSELKFSGSMYFSYPEWIASAKVEKVLSLQRNDKKVTCY